MYRLILESLLGLRRRGNELSVRPLAGNDWQAFRMQYRFRATPYDIACRAAEPGVAARVILDGIETSGDTIALVDDGRAHSVVVTVAAPTDRHPRTRRNACNSE